VTDVPAPLPAAALRRTALACAVLHDVDLEPYREGIVLRGGPPLEIPWESLARAVGGSDPESATARRRVLDRLRVARALADLTPDELALRVRPVGLPVGHALHPGSGWVRRTVLGGVLDLGLGLVDVGPDPDAVLVVPPDADPADGMAGWWYAAEEHLERVGGVTAGRLASQPKDGLRPVGDCDAVTLLGSATFRAGVCGQDPTGLRAVAVPMRTRGWLDLSRIDPAFVLAAAAATEPEERGFERPLLLTAEEVVLAPAGGRPAEIVLRDPAPATGALRDVRWR
jgi:hypothetical protein